MRKKRIIHHFLSLLIKRSRALLLPLGVVLLLLLTSSRTDGGGVRVRSWTAMGNSFTLHSVTDFWWGLWGMAATHRDSDYVHVLHRLITEQQQYEPELGIANIVQFEYSHASQTVRASTVNNLRGDEQLVVLRIGECAGSLATYTTDLERLVDSLRERAPEAVVVITGTFWPHYERNACQRAAALSRHCVWVPLDVLYGNDTHSSLDTQVMGDDGEWHLIKDGGSVAKSVALHANNLGHRRIAQAIFDSLQAFYARPDGVESLRAESWEVVRTEYFDLYGRALPGRPAKGLCIRRVTYRDGRWESFKLVR